MEYEIVEFKRLLRTPKLSGTPPGLEHSAAEQLQQVPEKPPHVLVVDDEPAVVLLVVQMLEREGILVRTALNGSQAVKLVQQDGDIRVVVLDWRMPGMSGDEVLDRLIAIRPNIRAIVLSGTDLEDVERAFTGRHVVRFLKKPSDLPVLATTVKSALSGGTARHAG